MAWSPKPFACPLALVMAGTIATMTLTDPSIAHGETKLVPSLAVSERYDSNVFFVPGGSREDYVTNISPQVTVDHKGRLIDGTFRGGATAEVYVKNPGLNYIASIRRSEEHTSELQSLAYLVCRLLLEKKKRARTHDLSDNELRQQKIAAQTKHIRAAVVT